MCYVVAKNRDAIGCFALRAKHGKELVSLKRKIKQKEGLQVITISKPAAYGEYAPYVFANTEEEFLQMVGTL